MDPLRKTKVHFFSLNVRAGLKNTLELKKFIELIFKKEKRSLNSISYIFCSDKKLLDINKKYLHHNYYTDVITFDLSPNNKSISAEVYISIERVRDNAQKLRVPIKSELHRVLFHAALHLCGYNDKSKEEIEVMRNKEDLLLFNFFSK